MYIIIEVKLVAGGGYTKLRTYIENKEMMFERSLLFKNMKHQHISRFESSDPKFKMG